MKEISRDLSMDFSSPRSNTTSRAFPRRCPTHAGSFISNAPYFPSVSLYPHRDAKLPELQTIHTEGLPRDCEIASPAQPKMLPLDFRLLLVVPVPLPVHQHPSVDLVRPVDDLYPFLLPSGLHLPPAGRSHPEQAISPEPQRAESVVIRLPLIRITIFSQIHQGQLLFFILEYRNIKNFKPLFLFRVNARF